MTHMDLNLLKRRIAKGYYEVKAVGEPDWKPAQLEMFAPDAFIAKPLVRFARYEKWTNIVWFCDGTKKYTLRKAE